MGLSELILGPSNPYEHNAIIHQMIKSRKATLYWCGGFLEGNKYYSYKYHFVSYLCQPRLTYHLLAKSHTFYHQTFLRYTLWLHRLYVAHFLSFSKVIYNLEIDTQEQNTLFYLIRVNLGHPSPDDLRSTYPNILHVRHKHGLIRLTMALLSLMSLRPQYVKHWSSHEKLF